MKEEFIKYLVCPICGTDFKAESKEIEKERVKNAILNCQNKHSFKIINFIPRLVPEIKEAGKKKTINSFAQKWEKNKDYALKVAKFQREWYLRRYGFNGEKEFNNFLKDFKFILEAGCGVGKDTAFFANNTEGIVFAVDISSAVDHAYLNHKNLNNAIFVQADITNLPFRDNFFDFISCDQVIHHTPNTSKTFAHLIKKTKPKGKLGIYVYKVKGPIREFCDDYIRSKATKLSFEECYKLCEPITKLGKALSDLKVEFDVPEDIPILKIKKGKYDLQRFFYYNVLKCFWNDDFDYPTNVSINADWYNPEHAHRHTKEEIEGWCKDNNVSLLYLDEKEEAGISFIVQK
jgi:ubiquinone/menaquinone biosynthesis C-methylase UbiE